AADAQMFLDSLWQDLRYAFRMLRKSPGFTAVAVLTLALGIGANTAIFSAVDAVILHPLPFKDSTRIVTIEGYFARRLAVKKSDTQFKWADWTNATKTLDDISVYEHGDINLVGGSQAMRVQAAEVSENFFDALGVRPLLGRTFTAEEEESNLRVAILSASFWRERFEADPNLIGKAIELNGKPFTVIGTLPTGFNFPESAQIWLPLPTSFNEEMFGGNAFMGAQIARLRSGATMRQARAELEAIEQQEDPEAYKYNRAEGIPIEISSLHSRLVGNSRTPMLLLFGAAVFVLLIACADVANLLVARSAGRSREVAIRAALGAGRSRLLQQFLCESVLFALLGGGLGLLCGVWTIAIARVLTPSGLLYITKIGMNSRVLVFTFGISVLVGIACGLIPAVRLSRVDLNGALKEASGGPAGRFSLRGRNRVRSALGISEIALALLLLVGAGLFLRSLGRLLDVNPGFRSDNLLTASVNLKEPKFNNSSLARSDFFEQVLARIKSQPDVRDAAIVNALPFGNAISVTFGLDIEGKPPFNPDTGQGALFFEVSENYFHTMGIPLLEGRYFTNADANGATPVAIISQEMALQCWPNENPLGKRFSFAGTSPGSKPFQVVGVVGDIRNFGLEEAPKPGAYYPIRQMSPDDAFLVAQARSNPTALIGLVRDAVRTIDKNEPISSFATMNQLISRSASGLRTRSIALTTFGGLALLLAIVGIYGVMSYAVTERTHEIGVRMALGAQPGDVLRMVVREGMLLAAVGIATGVVGALALTRFLRSFLFEITPTDAVTFMGVAILLATVVLLACYIPARRAMKVDPMVALRYE
ncbi:MAG TPA: ABC transporter permease, partial [Candidatus Acidoferrales bacterium]|nr:ABC transporter permease [Candidatus Acidoferrales bacterium]